LSDSLPRVTRVYQNHHLDSTRWECYAPRDGDIIVSTSYKCGTTWAQQILLHLLHGHEDPLPDKSMLSPWVEARFQGIDREALEERLESLGDRRFLKSHLPLDGLPYYAGARYLIVGRDPRDVFMSLFNHYSGYTEAAFESLNGPEAVGPDFPRCPEDPRELWQQWITRGWFEWESEGYPFWSNLHHTQSFWEWRRLPNFLFVHYNDMLADLPGKVREIATFCAIEASDAVIDRTVEVTTFANVRKRVEETPPEEDMMSAFFEGGQRRFFNKGTNGRWRDVLTDDDIALYEDAKARVLDPACAKWLESGGSVAG
jgi:aryl sulfotransferase